MQLKIGLEKYFEDKAIAWAVDYPGCFAYGEDEQEALMRIPDAFLAYQNWINHKAGDASWLKHVSDFDIRLLESFHNYRINSHYEVVEQDGNIIMAWFHVDWLPLTSQECSRIDRLLDWSRKDLLDLIAVIPEDQMDIHLANERWSIREILNHIGGAEWWYLERLNLAGISRTELPKDLFERLDLIRKQLKKILPEFQDRELVTGKGGEFWSPRKVLRRSLWHEKDHIVHIQKLLFQLQNL